MPYEIVNDELYADRTVQDWHREVFDRNAWAIDIDLMGACHSCREPLYLIESTTNRNKPISILKRLALRSGLPLFIVWHSNGVVTDARQVLPTSADISDEPLLREVLTLYRNAHMESNH